MSDATTQQIHAAMRGLVASLGKIEVAAQLIADRRGGDPQKGTLSKKMSRQLEWDSVDILALEDAAGRYPVTAILSARVEGDSDGRTVDMMHATGEAMREAGEAASAMLRAIASGSSADMAKAAVEWREAAEAFQRVMPVFDGGTSAAIPMRGARR